MAARPQRQRFDRGGGALHDQAGQDRQPQTVLGHRNQRRVVHVGIAHMRQNLVLRQREKRGNIQIKALGGHQEVRSREALDRKILPLGRIIRRQHRQQLVHLQREPVQPLEQQGLIADKGAVERLVLDAVVHLLDAAYRDRGVDLGILVPEIRQDRRQPLP